MFTHKLRYIFILLLSGYSFLNILFTEGNKIFNKEPEQFTLLAVISFLVLFIWEGNRLIESWIYNYSYKKPSHSLLIFFLTSIGLVGVLSVLTTFVFNSMYPSQEIGLTLKLVIGFSFRINLFLHCINAIILFMNKYREASIESEQLKKMHAEAKFEALRNQINPHFLFNSFNVLSNLVYKDPDTSSKFIDQLGDVYRYLLYNQDNRLVTIKDEMRFIESYFYLLKIRFGESIILELSIDNTLKEKLIAPATLQMLVENAIKHNIASKKDPLTIKICNKNDHIVVENTKNLKKVMEDSSGIGLKNIEDRYKFLSHKHAIRVISNGTFKVEIPIIDIDK